MTCVAPGVALTLWHGAGLAAAVSDARAVSLLREARPEIVQLHSAPTGYKRWGAGAVRTVREALPGARLWFGVGCDGWARDVASNKRSVAEVVAVFIDVAKRAVDAGAELIVWNAEGAYKDPRVVSSGLARAIVATCAARFPALPQGHTAYDHPTYHSGYDWRGWLGPGSPVVLALPQVYAAGDTEAAGYKPHVRGRLPAREARALASWKTAVRNGWIKPDVEPDVPDDLDWRPYLQIHHVSVADTVRALCQYDVAAAWAAPTRMDAEGRLSVVAACEMRRRGFVGPGAVRRFQSSVGLVADDVCGPRTLRALGLGA
jgi:hypothetical protein